MPTGQTKKVFQAAVIDWELERPNHAIAIVTNNTGNMEVDECKEGLKPHKVLCACGKPAVFSGSLVCSGRCDVWLFFFLQKLVQMPTQRFTMAVYVQWNSTLDILIVSRSSKLLQKQISSPQRHNTEPAKHCYSGHLEYHTQDHVKLLYPLKTAIAISL